MIEILDQNSNLNEYESFILQNKYGHFMQSTKWARLKSNWNFKIIIIKEFNNIIGSMLILIRKISNFLPYTIMYSPRGPIYDFEHADNKTILYKILNTAKNIAYQNKSYILKIDPNINIKKNNIIFENFGFTINNNGNNFENIQPKFVFRLNTYNKNNKEIFENFKPKTRYNIRYAQRKGIYIKICNKDMLPCFYDLMIETSIRDKFIPRNLNYFKKMMDVLGDNIRLYMAFTKDNLPISGAISVNYSKKVWYLYGASSNKNRNLMPNYLLQYEMIKWAIDTNCYFYDFRGVSGDINNKNNPLYGLYKFKKGFNGELIELIGEYDFTTNNFIKFLFNNFKNFYTYFRRKKYFILKSIKKFNS